jgi:hypothetical protein
VSTATIGTAAGPGATAKPVAIVDQPQTFRSQSSSVGRNPAKPTLKVTIARFAAAKLRTR